MRAVDRDAIADVLYDGHCHAAVQPYPANYWAHVEGLDDQEAAAFDPDAARELLAEAGVADGFSVTISSNSVTTYQRLAEVVQEQLGQIGIDATVEVSTDVTADQRDGDFDIIVGPFQAGRPDPSIFLEDLYAPDGRRNFGGIEFDEVPELIEASRRSTDVAERATAIGAILERVVAQGPILVPVCIPEVTTALRPGVSGIVISNRQNYDFRHAVVAS